MGQVDWKELMPKIEAFAGDMFGKIKEGLWDALVNHPSEVERRKEPLLDLANNFESEECDVKVKKQKT